MSDIFISYARRDERLAERLAEALRRQGWTVWWDAFLRVGEGFSEGLQAALNEAGVWLCCGHQHQSGLSG
jgi:adenylate cyclase